MNKIERCDCGGRIYTSKFTNRQVCRICGKHQGHKAPEGDHIEILIILKDKTPYHVGYTKSLDEMGTWFTGAFQMNVFPNPEWEQEMRVVERPSGKRLATYRVGWVEVQPINEPKLEKEARVQ